MNTVVASKEEILKASRELIRQQGWSAVSIRSVAAACGVSVGLRACGSAITSAKRPPPLRKIVEPIQKTSPTHRGRRGFSISRHDVTGRISGAGCGEAACRWR